MNRLNPKSHKRFFWRNLAVLMSISLIPVIVVGVFSVILVNTNTRRNILAANEVMLNQSREMVEYVFGELDSINTIFSASSNIVNNARSILRHDGVISFEELQILRILQSFLDGLVNSRTYIHSIYIYFDDSPHRFLSSGIGIVNTETFADTNWIDDYSAQPRDMENWTKMRSISDRSGSSPHGNVISIFRRIHSPGMPVPEGVMVLNIRADYINLILESFRFHPDNTLLIRDRDENILFSTAGSREEVDFSDDNGTNQVMHVFSNRYDWEFISVIPVASLNSMGFDITSTTIIVAVILIGLALFGGLRINRTTYSGLNRILEIFDAAHNQKPLPSITNDRKNEYYQIAENIVKTFVEQDYLKIQLSERKYRLQALELNALKMQVNPHFLFNVMETLYWKVFSLTGNKNEANVIIEDLSDILKYSLYGQSDIVSLGDEIKYTKTYLSIQKIRFSESLDVCWSYGTNLTGAEIPKLILQPIIENCIHHGINETKGKSSVTIKIKIYVKDHVMNIIVMDNGAGISAERLEELQKQLKQDDIIPDMHIGLLNTHKRLVLLYGVEYGIRVRSKEGYGTLVHLTFPYRQF